jgi:hypothetical protein
VKHLLHFQGKQRKQSTMHYEGLTGQLLGVNEGRLSATFVMVSLFIQIMKEKCFGQSGVMDLTKSYVCLC